MRPPALKLTTPFILPALLTACGTIGTGKDTLVLGTPPHHVYAGHEFDELLRTGDRSVVIRGDRGWLAIGRMTDYQARYPEMDDKGVALDITARDKTITPALSATNIQNSDTADVGKISGDTTRTDDQKKKDLRFLNDTFREAPESYLPLVPHAGKAQSMLYGKPVDVTLYDYFPRITLDLSALMDGADPRDDFSMIGAALRIPDKCSARFVDFSPKAADLFDFSLGQLKDTASATGSVSVGSSSTTSSTNQSTPSTGTTVTNGTTGGITPSGSLSMTFSDELDRDLKSELDARGAGMSSDGKVFAFRVRANSQKRVAGTYTYDVLLQIPSEGTLYEGDEARVTTSLPTCRAVSAQVRIVGIIRHITKRGWTGVMKRVPEPTNDRTYSEVVIIEKTLPLWSSGALQPLAHIERVSPNLVVYTNDDHASFTVRNARTNEVILRGSGRESDLNIPLSGGHVVDVVFDPINPTTSGGSALVATDIKGVSLADDSHPGVQVVGVYKVEKSPVGGGKPKKGAK